MARIQYRRGYQVLVQLGDGEVSETFAHPALINTTRNVTLSSEVQADDIIDAADHSAPATKTRFVLSTDVKVDGAGVLHAPDLAEWVNFWQTGTPRNIKIATQGANAVTITVPMILTNFSYGGDNKETVKVQLTLEQADAPTVS